MYDILAVRFWLSIFLLFYIEVCLHIEPYEKSLHTSHEKFLYYDSFRFLNYTIIILCDFTENDNYFPCTNCKKHSFLLFTLGKKNGPLHNKKKEIKAYAYGCEVRVVWLSKYYS